MENEENIDITFPSKKGICEKHGELEVTWVSCHNSANNWTETTYFCPICYYDWFIGVTNGWPKLELIEEKE